MNNDVALYFYHGCNWSDIPARQQYLAAALAKYLPVVYFDGGADRRLSVTFHQPAPNVTVVRGLTAIGQRLQQRGLGKLAGAFANWKLRHLRRKFGRVIFLCAENWLCPHRFIRHDALIYDCIDPSFNPDPKRREIYQQREERILAESAQVFATADALAEACRKHNRNVMLLNNACEPSDYTPELLNAAKTPQWWPQTDRPIAAYLGSLDWRFDFDATERACREHPDLHFVLAGNVLGHLRERTAQMAALPNVTCPGRISLEDGRYLLSHCAVGLIPFTTGAMNDAINPVKMYVYAMLGKAMAGTPVRELISRPQIVATPPDANHFGDAIAMAFDSSQKPQTAAKLKQFAARNTWDDRAAAAWEVIQRL